MIKRLHKSIFYILNIKLIAIYFYYLALIIFTQLIFKNIS